MSNHSNSVVFYFVCYSEPLLLALSLYSSQRENLLRNQLQKSASFADSQFIFTVRTKLIQYWRVYRKPSGVGCAESNYELVDTVLLTRDGPGGGDRLTVMRTHNADRGDRSIPDAVYRPLPPTTDQELGPQDFDVHSSDPKPFVPAEPTAPAESIDNENHIVANGPVSNGPVLTTLTKHIACGLHYGAYRPMSCSNTFCHHSIFFSVFR